MAQIVLHDGAQRSDLLLVLLDFGVVPAAFAFELLHHLVRLFEVGDDGIVGEFQISVLVDEFAQVALNRIAVDFQQFVVVLLLTVQIEIQSRQSGENHHQQDYHHSVTPNGFLHGRTAIVIVAVVLRRVVTVFVLFHSV